MTEATLHDLFRGSTAGGSCGVVTAIASSILYVSSLKNSHGIACRGLLHLPLAAACCGSSQSDARFKRFHFTTCTYIYIYIHIHIHTHGKGRRPKLLCMISSVARPARHVASSLSLSQGVALFADRGKTSSIIDDYTLGDFFLKDLSSSFPGARA
jgi:hypothetical protein